MKVSMFLFVIVVCLALHAETVEVRQPGLVESVGQIAVGTVRCVGEAAAGMIAGSTTVTQVSTATPAIAVLPQPMVPVCPVIPTSVVVMPSVIYPAVPLIVPCYDYGHYGRMWHHRPCYRYCHPCHSHPSLCH